MGFHSIQAAELKQVIGALRPLEDGDLVRYAPLSCLYTWSLLTTLPPPHTHTHTYPPMVQPTYYYRLQKALSVMAHRVGEEEGVVPLYYFDVKPKEAVRGELPTHIPSYIETHHATFNLIRLSPAIVSLSLSLLVPGHPWPPSLSHQWWFLLLHMGLSG